MEIVAMDMKLRGMYIARQLSFHGVAFKIEEVGLSKDFVEIYDESVHLVSCILAREIFTKFYIENRNEKGKFIPRNEEVSR